MGDGEFKRLVARLERESAAAPAAYRFKVGALAALGFGILALVLAILGSGLLLLVGLVAFVAKSGGAAFLLLAKLGKLVFLLAIPLWYLGKATLQSLFVRLPAPEGREIRRAEAPLLFTGLDKMRQRMKGPRFHHVLLVNDVNAAVVQRPAFGLLGWPRNYLLLGLPLLESLPPKEAFAVVAHEYGHLAGSHSRFSGYIYRLRITWGTVQAYTDAMEGWLARLVAPMVRWYAPYFNAYTFVLARADEYQADAASARLVGRSNAVHALKRVNVAGSRHDRFMEQTYERIRQEPAPPGDLMLRWAAHLGAPAPAADASHWLRKALDRQASVWDTHPTLRARLSALGVEHGALEQPPPEPGGESAAAAWFGKRLDKVRRELQARWAEQVSAPWAERHEETRREAERLGQLRAQQARTADEEAEMLQLALRAEPDRDHRDALAAFNAQHADHALGLFLEGCARLDRDDAAGLPLLDRVMALDPAATEVACDRAHAFLSGRGDSEKAELYAQRSRKHADQVARRQRLLEDVDAKHRLVPHALDEEALNGFLDLLAAIPLPNVKAVYLARRVIPALKDEQPLLLGIELDWWGAWRGMQQEVIDRVAALEWPQAVMIVTLDHQYAKLKKKFSELEDARLA